MSVDLRENNYTCVIVFLHKELIGGPGWYHVGARVGPKAIRWFCLLYRLRGWESLLRDMYCGWWDFFLILDNGRDHIYFCILLTLHPVRFYICTFSINKVYLTRSVCVSFIRQLKSVLAKFDNPSTMVCTILTCQHHETTLTHELCCTITCVRMR